MNDNYNGSNSQEHVEFCWYAPYEGKFEDLTTGFESMQHQEPASKSGRRTAMWRNLLKSAEGQLQLASKKFPSDLVSILEKCQTPWVEDVCTSEHDGYAFDKTLFIAGAAYVVPPPYLGSRATVAAMQTRILAGYLNNDDIEDVEGWIGEQVDQYTKSSTIAGQMGYNLMLSKRERQKDDEEESEEFAEEDLLCEE